MICHPIEDKLLRKPPRELASTEMIFEQMKQGTVVEMKYKKYAIPKQKLKVISDRCVISTKLESLKDIVHCHNFWRAPVIITT